MKAVSNVISTERASIYDVARLARVSPATVSRFTHNASAVAPGTRARLTAAVERLQFRPSALARAVAARGRQSVGLILTHSTRPHAGLVLAELLVGVTTAAARVGWSVHLTQVASTSAPISAAAAADVASTTATGFAEKATGAAGQRRGILPIARFSPSDPASLMARHVDLVDGSLILDNALDNPAVLTLARGGRAVIVNRPTKGIPWVGVDNHLGGRIAAAHLVALGHRRIVILAGDGPAGRARLEGGRDELRERGIRPMATVDCRFNQDEARAAALRLLGRSPAPTGILCGSDWMAAGVLDAARSLGIAVPTDLSLVGFDDAILASVTTPELTTVRQPLTEVGRAAFQMLHLLLEDAREASSASATTQRKRPSAIAPLLVPPELIVRGSTARAPSHPTKPVQTASRGRREIHQP